MTTTKDKLRHLVSNFRQWWADSHTSEEIEELRTDDPGYPEWNIIESYFAELLKNNSIKDLDEEDQTNLLWLIARNWDIGSMIAWLGKGTELSYCGELQNSDFLMLAHTLTELEHPEFNDAKSQIVSSLKKFEELTPEIEEILLKFYNDEYEYTKRQSLYTLGKFGYYDLRQLVEKSWRTIDDEHNKMGCLYVVSENIKDEELLRRYLELTDEHEGQYLKSYADELRKKLPPT